MRLELARLKHIARPRKADEIAHVDFAGSAWRKDLIRSKPPMNKTEGRIVLAFNEFGFGTVTLKPTPWGVVPKGEWTDHED